jgi:hypothetical protein
MTTINISELTKKRFKKKKNDFSEKNDNDITEDEFINELLNNLEKRK